MRLKLYEQLVAFTGSLEGVGTALDKARDAYDDAYKRLCTGNDNIIRVGERLRRTARLQTKKQHSARTLESAGGGRPPRHPRHRSRGRESGSRSRRQRITEMPAAPAREHEKRETEERRNKGIRER